MLKIHLAICLASVDVAPFWRLTDPDSKVAARLTVDSEWIAAQLTPNPIVYVEIPVTDLERASRFYEEVFQFSLKSTMVDGYSMALFPAATGSSGASGALVKGDVYIPSKSGPIVYFGTENIDRALERVRKAGGKVLYPEKRLDGIGSVAEFEDSEGNRIALFAAMP